jgi:hypothetical protein
VDNGVAIRLSAHDHDEVSRAKSRHEEAATLVMIQQLLPVAQHFRLT